MDLRWRYTAMVAVAAIILAALVASGIVSPFGGPQPTSTTTQMQTGLLLASPAFKDGESIPSKYTCDGENISPPLTWKGAPAGTITFALIVEDLDAPAGTFTHWVVFNIPSLQWMLFENISASGPPMFPQETLAMQGRNSLGKIGYAGPCPPSGTHHYVFHLYALDTQLTLLPGATRQDLTNAMQGHVLAEAQFTGLYGRG